MNRNPYMMEVPNGSQIETTRREEIESGSPPGAARSPGGSPLSAARRPRHAPRPRVQEHALPRERLLYLWPVAPPARNKSRRSRTT